MSLDQRLDEIARRRVLLPKVAQDAGRAMSDTLTQATQAKLGGDLRMSRFRGGAAKFTVRAVAGKATLRSSGPTFVLANRGRKQRRGARGGSWGGFHIIGQTSARALRAGVEAARRAVRR